MQTWEVIKNQISTMKKDSFINFAKEYIHCDYFRNELRLDIGNCCNEYGSCTYCMEKHLEDEYEGYVIHRTLKRNGKEVYVCDEEYADFDTWNERRIQLCTTENKEKARTYTREEAIKIRDMLNKERIGKEYLWIVGKIG